MAVLDDLKNAVENYATNNCKTAFANFKITGGSGEDVLNENEIFEFKVQVTNQSHLDMKSVKVKVHGTQYADVAWKAGSFGDDAISSAFSLDAGQSYTTDVFRGKAKKKTGGVAKDIVTARIASWDASLDYILKDRTVAGEAEGKLTKKVEPD